MSDSNCGELQTQFDLLSTQYEQVLIQSGSINNDLTICRENSVEMKDRMEDDFKHALEHRTKEVQRNADAEINKLKAKLELAQHSSGNASSFDPDQYYATKIIAEVFGCLHPYVVIAEEAITTAKHTLVDAKDIALPICEKIAQVKQSVIEPASEYLTPMIRDLEEAAGFAISDITTPVSEHATQAYVLVQGHLSAAKIHGVQLIENARIACPCVAKVMPSNCCETTQLALVVLMFYCFVLAAVKATKCIFGMLYCFAVICCNFLLCCIRVPLCILTCGQCRRRKTPTATPSTDFTNKNNQQKPPQKKK